ncbi:hypothetical protein MA16_Dca027628 [Dendrobium catenatum]|uniref:Uncharacterized protein n=1 Tax=Dendrobium catenatum TaxID=906689 RepID=A0A2I0X6K2_9ASPA|nr:hypothetical protein MA16_Dca027628 [Dendrobium catenatum]
MLRVTGFFLASNCFEDRRPPLRKLRDEGDGCGIRDCQARGAVTAAASPSGEAQGLRPGRRLLPLGRALP